ncbi:MAG: helix-turn-helix transcriptional regulator [Promethearchaeota archaeon]
MPEDPMGRILNRYEIDSRIVECITANPTANIDIISKETGLSYTAVRNSLHRLISMNVLEQIERTTESRGRGRPAMLFRLTKGLQILIPPRQFQNLAVALIDQLIHEEGPNRVEQLLTKSANREATKLINLWKVENALPRTTDAMVERICDFFNRQGSNVRCDFEEGKHYIKVYNCIYSDIAISYPQTICCYHFNLIISLIKFLNTKNTVTHETSIAKGDPHCIYVIEQH